MKRSSNKAKQEIKKTEIIKQTKNNAKKANFLTKM